MIPISSESQDDDPLESPLVENQEYLVQGSLHEHIVVSVPPTTSRQSADELSRRLIELGRSVIVIAHNTHFMKLERLSKEEAEQVVERVVSKVTEEELALAQVKKLEDERDPTTDTEQAADSTQEKEVGDGIPVDSVGSRSGLRLVRGGGSGEGESGNGSNGGTSQGDRDKES